MADTCSYPRCPSGVNVKLFDERHNEIKSHLKNIEKNQEQMILLISNVSSLLANVDNIKKDLEKKSEEHDEIFDRLRKVETEKANISDLEEMKKAGRDWLWDIIKILIGIMVGWIGIKSIGK